MMTLGPKPRPRKEEEAETHVPPHQVISTKPQKKKQLHRKPQVFPPETAEKKQLHRAQATTSQRTAGYWKVATD
jgi:hypothetical protein